MRASSCFMWESSAGEPGRFLGKCLKFEADGV